QSFTNRSAGWLLYGYRAISAITEPERYVTGYQHGCWRAVVCTAAGRWLAVRSEQAGGAELCCCGLPAGKTTPRCAPEYPQPVPSGADRYAEHQGAQAGHYLGSECGRSHRNRLPGGYPSYCGSTGCTEKS